MPAAAVAVPAEIAASPPTTFAVAAAVAAADRRPHGGVSTAGRRGSRPPVEAAEAVEASAAGEDSKETAPAMEPPDEELGVAAERSWGTRREGRRSRRPTSSPSVGTRGRGPRRRSRTCSTCGRDD